MARIIPKEQLLHLLWQPGTTPPASVVPKATAPVFGDVKFGVEEQKDRYVLNAIPYRGDLYRVDLSSALLDGGASHKQDEWVSKLSGSEWRLPSGPLMMSILSTLYAEREGDYKKLIADMQKKVRKDFKDYFMMTSTRIKYASSGLDTVVHDYKIPGEEDSLTERIVGPDNWITPTCGFDDSVYALLGTRDLALLEQVSQWASTKKPYMYRLNSTPSSPDERALVLGVDDNNDRFYISAYGYINIIRPARGVAVQKISSGNGGGV